MSEAHQRRESIRFSGDVSPSDTETHTFELSEDCTVEDVTVRFYQGPRLDLHVVPFVETGGDRGRRTPLVNFQGSKQYVDGDDDLWPFDCTESVEDGELLGVEVENVDSENTYSFAVDVTVDYAGGAERAAVGVFERLAGVF